PSRYKPSLSVPATTAPEWVSSSAVTAPGSRGQLRSSLTHPFPCHLRNRPLPSAHTPPSFAGNTRSKNSVPSARSKVCGWSSPWFKVATLPLATIQSLPFLARASAALRLGDAPPGASTACPSRTRNNRPVSLSTHTSPDSSELMASIDPPRQGVPKCTCWNL